MLETHKRRRYSKAPIRRRPKRIAKKLTKRGGFLRCPRNTFEHWLTLSPIVEQQIGIIHELHQATADFIESVMGQFTAEGQGNE